HYSTEQSGTTLPDSPQFAPLNLTATAKSNVEIDLSWTYPGTDIDGFKIERQDPGKPFALLIQTTVTKPVTAGATYTFQDTINLAANSTYVYRVRAYNVSGDAKLFATASA